MADKKYKFITIHFDSDLGWFDTIQHVAKSINFGYSSGNNPKWKLTFENDETNENDVVNPHLVGVSLISQLEKPDLTKPVFKLFPKAKETVEASLCPLCGNEINAGPGPTEFRNKLSMTEYRISGMCQKCQDKTYGLDQGEIIMTFYNNIKNDTFFETNEHVFKEVRSRIFFQNYYCQKTDKMIPLEDIIKVIGTEDDVDTIRIACENWTKHDRTEMAIVTCCINKDDIVKDPEVQKLLDFQISNTITGDIILNGGILFQDGKVTFHT